MKTNKLNWIKVLKYTVYYTDILWNLKIERSETQYLTAHIMSIQYSIDATILTWFLETYISRDTNHYIYQRTQTISIWSNIHGNRNSKNSWYRYISVTIIIIGILREISDIQINYSIYVKHILININYRYVHDHFIIK